MRVLLNRLPPESALKTVLRDSLTDEERARAETDASLAAGEGVWSSTDLMLASVIDALNWVEYGVWASQGGKPRKPRPFQRPGVERDKPKPRSFATGKAAGTVTPLPAAVYDHMLRNRGEP